MSRVGILMPGDSTITATDLQGDETAASSLKLGLHKLTVSSTNLNLPAIFEVAAKSRVQAVIAMRNSLLNNHAKLIADLAITKHLPLMFERGAYVDSGGLVSYANSDSESFQRAAALVDKILKGRSPADLPVEQPMKFEFVVNLKTAKQLGITIPQWTLMKADRVIR